MQRNEKNLLYFIIGLVLTIIFALIAQFIYIQSFVDQVNTMFSNVDGLDDWIKYNINGFKKNLSHAFNKVDNINYQFHLINKKVDGVSVKLLDIFENNTNKIIDNAIYKTEKRIFLTLNRLLKRYQNDTNSIYQRLLETINNIIALEQRIYKLTKNLTIQLINLNQGVKQTNNLIQNNNNNICQLPSVSC